MTSARAIADRLMFSFATEMFGLNNSNCFLTTGPRSTVSVNLWRFLAISCYWERHRFQIKPGTAFYNSRDESTYIEEGLAGFILWRLILSRPIPKRAIDLAKA